jgi:GH25 family lysozyme M1 (1,4-beta-N-acetylmuramidase)
MERCLGCDVSFWNSKIDFVKMKSMGISFCCAKASQLVKDSRFDEYWPAMKDAGLLRFSYHYLDWRKSEIEQAQLFCDTMNGDWGELPPVLDLEMNPAPLAATNFQLNRENLPLTSDDMDVGMNLAYRHNPKLSMEKERELPLLALSTYSLEPREVQGKVWNFLQTVEKITKRIPMIYSGFFYWLQWMNNDKAWAKYPFWLAWYANEYYIKVPPPWTKWTIWQYTGNGDGSQYGSQGLSLDMNWFNGSMEELKEFANIIIPEPTPAPIPIPIPMPPPTNSVDYVTTTIINIRSKPIVDSGNWVRYSENGEILHIKSPLIRTNGYLQLTDDNWAAEQFLKPLGPAPLPPSPTMFYATISMNIRSSPDATSSNNIIGVISKDAQVYVDNIQALWVHVAPFNLFPNGGWCSRLYMKPLGEK